MPNRRRRKLSTAMSTVAALAIASPCAYFLVYESTVGAKPAAEHYEFKQAASIADLPEEVLSVLSQGLSQFGINLPLVPSLTGTGDTDTSLRNPGVTSPGLTNQALGTPGLTAPGTGLTTPMIANPRPDLNPGGPYPGEVPITTPIALNPGPDGTYPIIGDSYTLEGISPTSPIGTSSGGIVSDLVQAANDLGTMQVIDLIKGAVMPAIIQAVENGGAAGTLSGSVTPVTTSLIPVT